MKIIIEPWQKSVFMVKRSKKFNKPHFVKSGMVSGLGKGVMRLAPATGHEPYAKLHKRFIFAFGKEPRSRQELYERLGINPETARTIEAGVIHHMTYNGLPAALVQEAVEHNFSPVSKRDEVSRQKRKSL